MDIEIFKNLCAESKIFKCKNFDENSSTTHVVNYNDCVIVIKNVPCIECIHCGAKFYTDKIFSKLEKIVADAKKLFKKFLLLITKKSRKKILKEEKFRLSI